MMSIDYTHCLRRRFTENILTPLLDGTSVNVVIPEIANEDKEANRLVKDIQGCELPNAKVLAVNMLTRFKFFFKKLKPRHLSQKLQGVFIGFMGAVSSSASTGKP